MAMRAFFAFCLFVAGALLQYFWEFIRTALYGRGLQILALQIEGISVDTIVHYGLSAVLFGCGAFLVWPSRPNVLRWGRSPLRLFLDRDPKSEEVGIQTFSGVTYIQISVATSKPIRALRAWYRRSDYSLDRIVPFSVEHNEQHTLRWSKTGGTNVFEVGLKPSDPPIRINVATFNDQGLQFEPKVPTPEHLFNDLQRVGIHRFEIGVAGIVDNKEVSETRHLYIDWRGPGSRTAFIKLERP
jgi:hypothetical protein